MERKSAASGTSSATCGGVKRMPPPMTLETMMAAASSGPSRRSRAGTLLSQQLTIDLVLAEFLPVRRRMLGEDVHLCVHEVAVLQHLQAGFRTGIAQVGSKNDETRRGVSCWQAIAIDASGVMVAPRLRIADLSEDRHDLDTFHRLGGNVL